MHIKLARYLRNTGIKQQLIAELKDPLEVDQQDISMIQTPDLFGHRWYFCQIRLWAAHCHHPSCCLQSLLPCFPFRTSLSSLLPPLSHFLPVLTIVFVAIALLALSRVSSLSGVIIITSFASLALPIHCPTFSFVQSLFPFFFRSESSSSPPMPR